MHKIQEKEFTLEDFSHEQLFVGSDETVFLPEAPLTEDDLFLNSTELLRLTISVLNEYRNRFINTGNKAYWWQMIQLLPSSYNQTRNVMMNYEVLCNIYKSRKDHKLDEWREFCKWIEEELPYSELIINSSSLKCVETGKTAVNGIQEAIKDYIFPFKDNHKED